MTPASNSSRQAKETARDLGAAMDCESRARLATEARILERCARQLEQGLAEQDWSEDARH